MDCILGMEFITHNNVLIKRHNILVIISSKSGIVWVKAHEVLLCGWINYSFDVKKNLGKIMRGRLQHDVYDAGVGWV
jgi:hypothetical protein